MYTFLCIWKKRKKKSRNVACRVTENEKFHGFDVISSSQSMAHGRSLFNIFLECSRIFFCFVERATQRISFKLYTYMHFKCMDVKACLCMCVWRIHMTNTDKLWFQLLSSVGMVTRWGVSALDRSKFDLAVD